MSDGYGYGNWLGRGQEREWGEGMCVSYPQTQSKKQCSDEHGLLGFFLFFFLHYPEKHNFCLVVVNHICFFFLLFLIFLACDLVQFFRHGDTSKTFFLACK